MGTKTIQVLGAGRQGGAIAYALAQRKGVGQVVISDVNISRARITQGRIRDLVPGADVVAKQVDGSSIRSFAKAFHGTDVVISAIPHRFNWAATKAALRTGTSYTDLGMDPKLTDFQHAQSDTARRKNMTLIPDNGLAPGLVIFLAAAGLAGYPGIKDLRIYCGGLPQNPELPLWYVSTWSLAGLIAEYTGECQILRNRRLQNVPALSEPISIPTPGLPAHFCETDHTAGGISTAAQFFKKRKLLSAEYRTVRYYGHFQWMRENLDAIVSGSRRKLRLPDGSYARASEIPKILAPKGIVQDLVYVRIAGRESERRGFDLELLAKSDEETGFTAMERTTGFSAALIAEGMARGLADTGTVAIETLPFTSPHEQTWSNHILGGLDGFGIKVESRAVLPSTN